MDITGWMYASAVLGGIIGAAIVRLFDAISEAQRMERLASEYGDSTMQEVQHGND